jgi:methyl-accepting chemotaxis protein
MSNQPVFKNSKDQTQEKNTNSGIEFRKSTDDRKVFVKGGEAARIYYNPKHAPQSENEKQDSLMLEPSNAERIPATRSFWFRASQTIGVLGSIAWIVLCVFYFILEGGFVTQTPYEMGIFIAGMTAPVAFFWMILSYMQRNSDVRYYAESMRGELHSLFFPSDEDSHRVNRDIERMALQAAELASSSKAALKAIHRTRQGLHHEIKEFVSLARKAENHILTLSDNMIEKTSGLADLTDTIEKRVQSISAKTEQSISAWDESSVRMIERASEIESTMDKGANRILSMADVAEEKSKAVSEMFDGTITSLGLTVDAVIDRLGGINDEFSSHTRTLDLTVQELSKESGRLGAMFDDQIEQINDATARSVETLTQSVINVGNQKDILEESANHIASQAGTIAGVVETSVSQLTEAANTISDKAENVGARISDKAKMISESLNGLDDQIDRIDSVSEIASHRLSEGIETAVNGSTQISDAIRRGVETLTRVSEDATSQATSQIEAVIAHINQLKGVNEGNVSSVENMLELLERSRTQIEQASQVSAQHVTNLTKAVEGQSERLETSALSLADQVKSVSRALEEPLRLVGIAIADADGRHEQIQTTLERRIEDLRNASDKATESVEIIRQSLREQTNEIASLSGKVTSQAKTLNEELSENQEKLNNTVTHTLSDMTQLIDRVETAQRAVEKSTQCIITDLTEVGDLTDISLNRLNDASLFAGQALTHVRDQYIQETDRLENKIEEASLKIDTMTDKVIYASDKITPVCDRLMSGSDKAMTAMNQFRETYTDTATEVLDHMDKSSHIFDDRLTQLKEGVGSASETLKSAGQFLATKLDDIDHAAKSANQTMQKLASQMEGQSSDIHILTDQTILKVETIQKAINDQFLELSQAVGAAVSQIEDAGEDFEKRTDKMSLSAEEVLSHYSKIGEEVETKAYALKQATQNVANTAHQVVSDITKEMETLDTTSETSLMNLRKTSDTLSIKTKEIDHMMKSVLDQAKAYSADMRDQVRSIAQQSNESTDMIGKSISTLLSQMDDVNGKTQSVVSVIRETNQSLYDQSGRFVTAVSKSAQAAEHAVDMFSKQSDAMLKSARIAVEKAQEIEKTELRVGRENFLSSARFVLESLHSLSIDFVRMIDGEISEKDWKAYQKGDVGLFTAHVAKTLDQIPADKIRNKYSEDTEFRNYVQKFMRQFEDILEQTDTVDRGAVLGTTFAASDVGKIYRFFVNVTGRDIKRKAA